MENLELLPTREALAFDVFRFTNVQGVNLAGQSNTAGALLGSAAGYQWGAATATQGIYVNQL
jgi:hypothetical protein